MSNNHNNELYWKNFNLGSELQIAGTFIYNGIETFDKMTTFYNEEEVFEFLYNLSVGVERLLKINVILIEHSDKSDYESFFNSIKNHNHQNLLNRIEKKYKIEHQKSQNKLIEILNTFYNSLRYERFEFNNQINYKKERDIFIKFLSKYSDSDISTDFIFATSNNLYFKKIVGEIIKGIVLQQYEILKKEASRLNIFTYEIRYSSKASKIFMMEEFTFENQNLIQKELVIELINKKKSKLTSYIKSIKPLGFDSYSEGFYLKCLLDRFYAHQLDGDFLTLCENIEDLEQRKGILDNLNDFTF